MLKKILIAGSILVGGLAVMGMSDLIIVDHSHDDGTIISHSGGTNSDGCHTNHKTGDYHCHNPKD